MMNINYYNNEVWEVYEEEWEAIQEYLAEEEALAEMPKRPYPTEEEMIAMAIAYGEN